MDIMKNFSLINWVKVAMVISLVSIYVFLVLAKWKDSINSQRFIGVAGVALVSISVAAGLGFCALLRLPFNAATTQIMPFLSLSLGMYALFLLVNTYSNTLKQEVPYEEITGEVLKQMGPVLLLMAIGTVLGFVSAYVIPLPALRAFVMQAAILVAFVSVAMLTLFPAIASLDLRRRRSKRMDLFCCFLANAEDCENAEFGQLNDLSRDTKKCPVHDVPSNRISNLLSASTNLPKSEAKVCEPFLPLKKGDRVQCSCQDPTQDNSSPRSVSFCEKLTLNYFVTEFYAPLLSKRPFKIIFLLAFAAAMCTCLSGIPYVRDGLELTDIVPRDTTEYKFLDVQRMYFNFFNIFAVTQGNFEYPTNQKLLFEYHHSFTRVGKIIKNDDGGLPDFWLSMFRDWLRNLQQTFYAELQSGCITQEGWFNNASDDAILAYKLLVQTGRVDNPVDKSLVSACEL